MWRQWNWWNAWKGIQKNDWEITQRHIKANTWIKEAHVLHGWKILLEERDTEGKSTKVVEMKNSVCQRVQWNEIIDLVMQKKK